MENYTDFELMISRSINKLHDARRKAEAIEAPTIDSTGTSKTDDMNNKLISELRKTSTAPSTSEHIDRIVLHRDNLIFSDPDMTPTAKNEIEQWLHSELLEIAKSYAAIEPKPEAPTIEGIVTDDNDNPVDDPSFPDRAVLDVRMPTDRCPMCGLGPQEPISKGLVLIDEDTKLNPKMLKHYSCRGCGWWWSNKGGEE